MNTLQWKNCAESFGLCSVSGFIELLCCAMRFQCLLLLALQSSTQLTKDVYSHGIIYVSIKHSQELASVFCKRFACFCCHAAYSIQWKLSPAVESEPRKHRQLTNHDDDLRRIPVRRAQDFPTSFASFWPVTSDQPLTTPTTPNLSFCNWLSVYSPNIERRFDRPHDYETPRKHYNIDSILKIRQKTYPTEMLVYLLHSKALQRTMNVSIHSNDGFEIKMARIRL